MIYHVHVFMDPDHLHCTVLIDAMLHLWLSSLEPTSFGSTSVYWNIIEFLNVLNILDLNTTYTSTMAKLPALFGTLFPLFAQGLQLRA